MRVDIQRIRMEKNYTQEELAEKLNLSSKTIANVENYKDCHSPKTVQKILQELEIVMSNEEYIKACKEKPGDFIIGKMEIDSTKSPVVKDKLKEKLIEADKLCEKKKYKEALEIYLSFSKLLGEESCYLLGCAFSYNGLGKHEKAIKYCDKIINNKNKDEKDALYIKGTSLGILKRYDESIETLEKLLKLEENREIYYNLGVAYMMKDKIYKAIENYEKCLEIDDKFTSAHLNVGVCYLRTFKHDKCMYHLKRVMEREPNMYQPYAVMGSCYKDMGKHKEAIVYYEKCLEMDDENYEALLGIFMCLGIVGERKKAEFYSDKFFGLYPEFLSGGNKDDIKEEDFAYIGATNISDETVSVLYPTLGKVFFDNKKFDEAVNKIKESVPLLPMPNGVIHINFEENIKVNILGLENNILIEMVFDDYSMLEINTKYNDIKAFKDLFEKHHQFRIQLECKSNFFVIDCLKNINFKL